jgi:hypothetical protein
MFGYFRSKRRAEVSFSVIYKDHAYADLIEEAEKQGIGLGARIERERILQGIQKLEDQSHATRTPLYQDTMFAKIRSIINGTA